MPFISDHFLLQGATAERLFQNYAEGEPILDYHCHLPVREIAENRQFRDLTEIWLEGDHYKWRAMRANGVAEALTNVQKHSHATRVRVAAAALDGGVVVEVSDDGTGFVVDECLYVPGHLGLLAMKERAQLAGGWCRIVSEPGAGAKVEFWVPTT